MIGPVSASDLVFSVLAPVAVNAPELSEPESEAIRSSAIDDWRADARALRAWGRAVLEMRPGLDVVRDRLGPRARAFAESLTVHEISVLASASTGAIRRHLLGLGEIPHLRGLHERGEPRTGLRIVPLDTPRARDVLRGLEAMRPGEAIALLAKFGDGERVAVEPVRSPIAEAVPGFAGDGRLTAARRIRGFIERASELDLAPIRARLGDDAIDRIRAETATRKELKRP